MKKLLYAKTKLKAIETKPTSRQFTSGLTSALHGLCPRIGPDQNTSPSQSTLVLSCRLELRQTSNHLPRRTSSGSNVKNVVTNLFCSRKSGLPCHQYVECIPRRHCDAILRATEGFGRSATYSRPCETQPVMLAMADFETVFISALAVIPAYAIYFCFRLKPVVVAHNHCDAERPYRLGHGSSPVSSASPSSSAIRLPNLSVSISGRSSSENHRSDTVVSKFA